MEITQQPSTIGEMSPLHFETYITKIIKHVTDERFDIIERRLDRLESDFSELKTNVAHLKSDVSTMQQDVQEIKDTQSLNQSRFGLLERYLLRHDAQLEKQLA